MMPEEESFEESDGRTRRKAIFSSEIPCDDDDDDEGESDVEGDGEVESDEDDDSDDIYGDGGKGLDSTLPVCKLFPCLQFVVCYISLLPISFEQWQ